jgi:A/G-specific adenine glycosylase
LTTRQSSHRDFAARVIAWQRAHGRHDLPWQQPRDAYRVWLSEVMLQQTQVATVLPYFERFVAAFPTVEALASAPIDRVLEHWSGLGYYRRAHQLHAAARVVVERHGGAFPRDVASLAALPGVGRSTAGAIAALAFGERAPILDGNVKRVLARHRGVEGFPGDAPVQRVLWSHAEELLPRDDVAAYTQGLMDLGATLCTRAAPRCERCPVDSDCVARRDRRTDALPTPRAAKVRPHRELRLLLIEYGGEVLLERRGPAGVWAGLWSLPELPVESDVDAALRARFHFHSFAREGLRPIDHAFTHFTLAMHPEHVRVERRADRIEEPGLIWLTRDDALGAALPAPIKRLIASLGRDAVSASSGPSRPSRAGARAGAHPRRHERRGKR